MRAFLFSLFLLAPSLAHSEDVIFFFLGSTETLPVAIYASSGPASSQTIPLGISTTDQNVSNYFVVSSTDLYNVQGSTQNWGIWGVSRPTMTYVTITEIEAETGVLSGNMAISGGIVRATGSSGMARYAFQAPQAGEYQIKGLVDGPSPSANSFYFGIDTDPAGTQIWDIYPPTVGFQWRAGNWRGTGTEEVPQFNPKVFTLTAGPHTLILRARETGAGIDRIQILQNQFSWQQVGSSITLTLDQLPPAAP